MQEDLRLRSAEARQTQSEAARRELRRAGSAATCPAAAWLHVSPRQ